MIKVPVQRKWL